MHITLSWITCGLSSNDICNKHKICAHFFGLLEFEIVVQLLVNSFMVLDAPNLVQILLGDLLSAARTRTAVEIISNQWNLIGVMTTPACLCHWHGRHHKTSCIHAPLKCNVIACHMAGLPMAIVSFCTIPTVEVAFATLLVTACATDASLASTESNVLNS